MSGLSASKTLDQDYSRLLRPRERGIDGASVGEAALDHPGVDVETRRQRLADRASLWHCRAYSVPIAAGGGRGGAELY